MHLSLKAILINLLSSINEKSYKNSKLLILNKVRAHLSVTKLNLKEKLDANLRTAPLYDTPLFTKNLESAYKKMYERHHKGLKPDHIIVEHESS